MVAWSNIRTEVTGAADRVRRKYLANLATYTGRDTVIYASAFTVTKPQKLPPILLSITNQDMQGFMAALHHLKGEQLDLLIHSPGGSIEGAQQVLTYLRAKYKDIRVIVPQNAMSAATILACGANSILMGYHSALGPIDPQITIPTETGLFTAPAQSILDEFERAKTEVRSDRTSALLWAPKIGKYPPGVLKICEDAIGLSKITVENWLTSYMFLGDEDAGQKAAKAANWLGSAGEHKTHGKPIMFPEASQYLKIDLLENDPKLQNHVLALFNSIIVTFETTACVKFIENHKGKGWFIQAAVGKPPT